MPRFIALHLQYGLLALAWVLWIGMRFISFLSNAALAAEDGIYRLHNILRVKSSQ